MGKTKSQSSSAVRRSQRLNSDVDDSAPITLPVADPQYDDWSFAMRISLDAKNKIKFVDGSLPRPLITDPNFDLWSRCNSMVKPWLLNSVSPQIYRSILRMNDAADIWKDLCGRYHMTNLPRTFNLTQEIQDLRQGSMSLFEYYTRLKTLWDQLDGSEELDDPCVCGKGACLQQKAEKAKTVKFLAGLNESYAIVRRQIIAKKVLPPLVEVYHILDQDDSQKGFTIPTTPTAFQVSQVAPQMEHGFPPGFTPKGKFNEKFQKPPIVAAQVTLSPVSDKTSTNMENLIGNLSPDQLQNIIALFSSQLQSTSSGAVPAAIASTSQTPQTPQTPLDHPGISFSTHTYSFIGILAASKHTLSTDTWVIDSGATHHVSHDKNSFVSLDTSVESFVNMPTRQHVKISGVGMIRLNKDLLLTNVLFIPEFRLSLINIISLTSDLGSRVIFDTSCCEIQDPTKGVMIGKGRRIGKL
ncbi:PREDICTED: uncharacterized protein LOC104753562 [Camelina sativa]|uniref:Uncharacterized protein LOC104753562 n=1 Tax=Camelina sativa TaxID=90675 RepID=A0ABM0WPC0_CAMSA|nr:PREDICTED: uncharacterized protein LOC104753562 [Camelina sativa]